MLENRSGYWNSTGNITRKISGYQRDDSRKVTEKSEQERRAYWSEYWRKHNHIAKGCVTW